ncbi:MAG: ATP-dependent DNA helicase RecG [Chthonomonadales bacterium]
MRLSDEVQYVKWIGPPGAELLARLNILTVRDLLWHAPRRYEDRAQFRNILDLQHGEWATIRGAIIGADNMATSRKNFIVTQILIRDANGGVATITFFQRPHLLKRFDGIRQRGSNIIVYGLAKKLGYGPVELERAEWEEDKDSKDSLSHGRIVPVYPATEGLPQDRIRKMVDSVLKTAVPTLHENLPPEIILKYRLLARQEAARQLHFPTTLAYAEAGRRRFVFEEFFLMQVAIARRHVHRTQFETGLPFKFNSKQIADELTQISAFAPTKAQSRVIEEIRGDVTSGKPMNRLLQGDVGSGKTYVALAAILMAVRSGFQAAIMVPTEILAQQHAIVMKRWLEPLGIQSLLVTGSLKVAERESARKLTSTGMVDVVIGTHAIIQEGFEFKNLGLSIIDEQHRFGVLQRQALMGSGLGRHVLVMTATPIPRTLTMTIFGDLDTSILDELPPGRIPIKTHWKKPTDSESVYHSLRKLLDQGRQAYVVCPLIEESEKKQAKAASQLAEQIQTSLLPEYRIGLLHGQMKIADKDEVMRKFKEHEIDILVSTTVIEVGIDVPNASVIIIEDADKFGLSQLHQLRGRVGRGEHASFCILIGDPTTEEGQMRLQTMQDTQDGFRIAEVDLEIRGPGEFFGTRQSGAPVFAIGDVIVDKAIMEETRDAARQLVKSDPDLVRPEHTALRQAIAAAESRIRLASVS